METSGGRRATKKRLASNDSCRFNGTDAAIFGLTLTQLHGDFDPQSHDRDDWRWTASIDRGLPKTRSVLPPDLWTLGSANENAPGNDSGGALTSFVMTVFSAEASGCVSQHGIDLAGV